MDAPLNGDSPEAYMLKAAVLRRHLTDDQRAMMAARWKERNKQQPGPNPQSDTTTRIVATPESAFTKNHPATSEAMSIFKVSRQKVDRASYVQKRAPELADRVHQGEIALSNAYRQVRAPEERRKIESTKLPGRLRLPAGSGFWTRTGMMTCR